MAESVRDKVCKACGQAKSEDKFPKVSRARDGRGGTCYACRWASRSAVGQTDQQQKATRLRINRWKRRNPAKVAAHRIVWQAIKAGRLTRGSCAVCGSLGAEAHHEDYGAPLDVRWLCKGHHEEMHVRGEQKAA